MKPAKCLLMYVLCVLPAFSQTTLRSIPDSESILAAKSQYLRSDVEPEPQKDANAVNVPLAQIPRGRTRPSMSPPRMTGYPGGYPSLYGDGGARRQIIGALIGFGLGAALGARANTDQHPGAGVKAAFVVGGIGALIGAAVGSSMPSFQAPYRHRRDPWPEEDEKASLQHSRKRTDRVADRPPGPQNDSRERASVTFPREPQAPQPASEY